MLNIPGKTMVSQAYIIIQLP